jgi:hypothetical protein
MSNQPNLTFFCELPADDLGQIFDNPSVINKLKKLKANIGLGLLDLSPTRADLVKKLTRSGIPVTAWILLPKEKGYWTSLDTVTATAHRYGEFKKWTEQNDLQWAAVGLDIEPSLDRVTLFGPDWKSQIPDSVKRLFKTGQYRRSHADLRALINLIRTDGYAVETYNLPFVVEERKASSEIISRIFGTPPLDADREVLMLYSSAFKEIGDAILWSYAHQAQAIGIGSTGGGVELDGGLPMASLRWIDLRRDLLIAKIYSEYLYIFSLEGCVKNDFLDRLIDMDWDSEILMPKKSGEMVTGIRSIATGLLWIFSHFPILFFLIIAIDHFFRKRK